MTRFGLLLLLFVSAAFAVDVRTFLAPGVVSKVHDEFAGDCDQCHLAFTGVPDAKCLACHEVLATRIADDRGFHASVASNKAADSACMSCHPDHRGFDARITTDEALASFNHALTGFTIDGAHKALGCERCHTAPVGQMADTCGECHDDPHGSARGPDCGACHDDTAWLHDLKTLEAHATPMDGGHQGLGCEDCHLHGDHLRQDVGCEECHVRGHDGTTAPCENCHQVTGWKPASFDHGPCTCAFPGKHQTVECLACHEGFDFTDTPTLCAGCHEKDRPHEPLGECARCHDAMSWKDNRFDHDRSKFPLRGNHLAVSCTQCHPGPTPEKIGQLRGVPTQCAGCHAEAGMVAHGDFGACERCHSPQGFSPSSFDHATVGFPLTGRHSETPCQTCHAQKVQGYRPL
jgi:hypothetical protein